MSDDILMSVVIPCLNEIKYIEHTINSELSFETEFNYEVLFVDGMSTDGTREIISKCTDNRIKLIDNPAGYTPVGMNIGIKHARGDYVVIKGAHASYPSDYLQQLYEFHQRLEADAIGPIWNTEVVNKTKKSISILKVLSDPIGVGNALFRTGVDTIKEVDTVPYGCYKIEKLIKVGMFDERLIRNQDIELNKRIKNNGGKIYLIPDIQCTYYARETYSELSRNNYKNGLWNILTTYYTRSFDSLSLRHFIPLLFILSLIIPSVLILFHPRFGYLSLVSILLYFVLVSVRSVKLKSKDTSGFHILWAFITLHFSYGAGSLVGIYKVIKKKIGLDNE